MRRRLAVLALAITSLVVIAFTVPLILVVRREARERAQISAETQAQTFAALVALTVAGAESLNRASIENAIGDLPEGVGIVLPGGETIGDIPLSSEAAASVRLGVPAAGYTSDGWEVGIPVQTRLGVVGVVATATNQELATGVGTATIILGLVGIVVIGAAVAVADRLGRSLVRPVDELAGVARRLGDGELGARAVVTEPPEVAAVGTALNLLAERLGSMITAERESLADLSHRLRTPLTGLRLQAERLPETQDRHALLEGVDRMQTAVDGLIVAVRSGRSSTDSADVAEVVRRHLEFWGVLAREQGRPITAVLDPGPLTVPVGAEELGSMVDGLFGNVFSHTKPGTPFEVNLSRNRDSEIVLVVSDAGDGFPAGVDPMRRGVSGRGSTGLGLDIARRVAERCNGSVRLGRARLGGAEVVVTLRQENANPGL